MVEVSEFKYQSILNRRETEKAIDLIKTSFPRLISQKLNLFKLSCPLVIVDGTGINDDLESAWTEAQPGRYVIYVIVENIEAVDCAFLRIARNRRRRPPEGDLLYLLDL